MIRLLPIALVVAALSTVAYGQGVLVVTDPAQAVRLPRPPVIWPPYPRPMPPSLPETTYRVAEIDIDARIEDQLARVNVTQAFVNTGSRTLEASFMFPLPYDGAVDRLTLLVDGKEYSGRILGADEARRIYEETVRKNRDPALLEWVGRGMFRSSVFPIPPGAKRTVSLRYSQLLVRREGLTDFIFPLSMARYTAGPVERVGLRASITVPEELKNVYSPSHEVRVERRDDRRAVVTFSAKNEIPSSDFRLFFDVGKQNVGARLMTYRPRSNEDGYFLLLAAPGIKPRVSERVPKTVVFVIDRSGSMSGEKMEQARRSLAFVVDHLRQGDLFNIIAYDSEVESFRDELQRFADETRREALGFIDNLSAGGSTNIAAALNTALAQLSDTNRPSYVVFLTDGLPTAGETNEMKIAAAASRENRVRARLFPFGVGYDVNSRLLDKLARDNGGQSEYVRPEEDIEQAVSRLYRRIESPVMTGVELELVRRNSGSARVPLRRLYPAPPFDLFAGEQLVLVGRYGRSGDVDVSISGSVGGKEEKLLFAAKLASQSDDETHAFVEKLWAVRRVGEIIEQIDLNGKNDELVEELVDLSKRHGILTPYTSFLADESTSLDDLAIQSSRAEERLRALGETSGAAGVAQREYKGRLQRAATMSAAPSMAAAPAQGAAMDAFSAVAGRTPSAAAPAESEVAATASSVRQLGNRVFYRRQGQWIDSSLPPERQKAVQTVQQFSDEYFELVRRHGQMLSPYLAFDEPLMLDVAGTTYLIEPPAGK